MRLIDADALVKALERRWNIVINTRDLEVAAGLTEAIAISNVMPTVEQDNPRERIIEALAGLMKLTAAAYGHQVTEVPEYNFAKEVIEQND